MKTIGQMTITQALPYLEDIARRYKLNLNRLSDWKAARRLMAITYYSQDINLN